MKLPLEGTSKESSKCKTLDERYKLLRGAGKMQEQLMAAFKSGNTISEEEAEELRTRQGQLIDRYLEQTGLKSADVEDPLLLEDELDMDAMPPEAHAALFKMEDFLSRLSANLISAISHVVTPPSVLPMPLSPPKPTSLQAQSAALAEKMYLHSFRPGGGSEDTSVVGRNQMPMSSEAFRVPERVSIHLYIVRTHNKYDPLAPGAASPGFQLAQFKREMSKFKLGNQQLSYAVHSLVLSEDAALAMAFSSSLRSAVIPTLAPDGTFVTETFEYIDSLILQNHLEVVHSKTKKAPTTKSIPVFLFSLDSDVPVLVDKMFQARNIRNMVIAVQTPFTSWGSPLSCNGLQIMWDLHNPLRCVKEPTPLFQLYLCGLLSSFSLGIPN